MKQIIESLGLANLKLKIANIFHPETTGSFNKNEINFYGPVVLTDGRVTGVKKKLSSAGKMEKLND